uniref:Neuropeptide-Like Protein n=1 Tax=Rhabditophanes sp. KR3021 TaxID=114890 RepID=A0AC35TSD7_9BILA
MKSTILVIFAVLFALTYSFEYDMKNPNQRLLVDESEPNVQTFSFPADNLYKVDRKSYEEIQRVVDAAYPTYTRKILQPPPLKRSVVGGFGANLYRNRPYYFL